VPPSDAGQTPGASRIVTGRAVRTPAGAHHGDMRLHVALLLIGFLALRALPTDAQGRYVVLGVGAQSCTSPGAGPRAEIDLAYRVSLAGLMRVTCNLDDALLRMQNYARTNSLDDAQEPTDGSSGKLRVSRPKSRSGR